MADDKTAPQAQAENRDTPEGFLFALAAYFMWGFLPFYMKALAHVPAAEVVAHRALWSVPIAGVVLVALRRTADLKAALRSWPMIRMAMLTAGLISINWGVYVWAVGNGRTVETALGYYINPLFSVLLAATLLKERRTSISAPMLSALRALPKVKLRVPPLPAPGMKNISMGFRSGL